MKLESEKAGVILGFIGVSWVSRGTLAPGWCVFRQRILLDTDWMIRGFFGVFEGGTECGLDRL